MEHFRIADLNIGIECPESLLPVELSEFQIQQTRHPDIYWRVKADNGEVELPDQNWINFSGFSVCNVNDKTYVRYDTVPLYQVGLIVYEEQYAKATYYLRDHDWQKKSEEEQKKLSEYLFWFFRESFFLAVLRWNGISLHSASIVYHECGIAFSAMSQTGKSTHTNLWKERYNTPILDGDVTVVRMIDNQIYCYGLPWTGSSGLTMNRRVRLKAVVFLAQAPRNKVRMIKPYETVQGLYARSFTAAWLPELVKQQFAIIVRIQKRLQQAYILECLPDIEAVDLIKSMLDDNWDYIEWRK